MTNSDRYSPDDYNADQIDEDIVDQQGTGKAKAKKPKAGTKPVAGKRKSPTAAKRKPKASSSGTVAARLKRTDSDTDSKQDRQKAGANTTAKSVKAKTAAKTAVKKPAAKKPTGKKSAVKVPAKKSAQKTAQKTAKKTAQKTVKKTATNRVGKTALSKETTMKALAQQELVANSAARRKALDAMSLQSTSLQPAALKMGAAKKGTEMAGTGIIWTLLGIGLAACAGGTSYVEKEGSGGPTIVNNNVDPAELTKAKNELKNTQETLSETQETLSETQEALANVLGNTGQVSKGLPRGAKIYLLDKDGNRVPLLDSEGKHIVTDVKGQFDISNLTPAQRVQLSLYGYEADLTGSVDAMTGEVYTGGSVRSMPGKLASFSSPLTTLMNNLNSGEQQNVLNLLFPDSGITIDDILAQLNYRLVPESKKDGFDEKSNIIEKMAIRVMATLERFVSEDNSNKSASEKAKAAIKKLVDEINKVIDNNKDDSKDKQTVDDVEGLKSESEVQKQIEQAEKFGEGRPSAAPKSLSVDEDGILEIALSDFGFSDAEIDEEFGAITFTKLPNGTLTFTTTKTISYDGKTYNAGKPVDVIKDKRVELHWLEGGFTFEPAKDKTGDMQLEYQVEAKKKDKDYDSGNPADQGAEKSKEAILTIKVNPVNDTPTDTQLSGAAVLKAIQGVTTAKGTLDAAPADGAFATAHTALQNALDALIDLNIGGRPDREVSQADKNKIAEFINAIKALIAAGTTAGNEAADKAAYEAYKAAPTARTDDEAAITNDGAFTTLATETGALKVAEVYRVVDGAVDTGGGLTPKDIEDTGLERLSALNAAKKAIDVATKPTSLTESKAALTAFETFFTALSAVKAATNLGYMDDLAAKADAVLAALDTAYDAAPAAPDMSGLADERKAVVDALDAAKKFFSTPAPANTAIMKLLVDVDDAFAMLKSADATNIVARLKAFVDALGKLDAGDGNAAQSVAVIMAATTLLNELFDPAHTNTARDGYTTALDTLTGTTNTAGTATPPFTISDTISGSGDAALFGFKLVKKPSTDDTYEWQLVLTGAAKSVGATYEITVTYNDADGGSYTETYVLVQDVSEKGFYLSTDSGTTKEYSGQHDVLNPNAGGPTLAEDVNRFGNREADGDHVKDEDASNDFSFTGGLASGGKWTTDGKLSGAITALEAKDRPTFIFASAESGDTDAKSNVTVDVATRTITITLKKGDSLANVKTLLDAYFAAPATIITVGILDNTADEINEVRAQLQELYDLTSGEGITFDIGEHTDGLPYIGTGGGMVIAFTRTTRTNGEPPAVPDSDFVTPLNKSWSDSVNKSIPAIDGRAKKEDKAHEMVTIKAGSITLADGTTFDFAETAVMLSVHRGANRNIESGDKVDMMVYVLVEGVGTARTVTVKAVATTDFATTDTEAGKQKFVIGTADTSGIYTPNMAAPTASWTVHEEDGLKPEDFNTTPMAPNKVDDTLAISYEYALAPKSDSNNNDEFHLSERGGQHGIGESVSAKQTLTHVGWTTPDYEGAAPTLMVELTRKTIVTRLHEANFNGFKNVQVDGVDNSGDDDATNDATFSYAARSKSNGVVTRGEDADDLITVNPEVAAVIRHPIKFVITFDGADDAAPSTSVTNGEIEVTFAGNATVADIIAYLKGGFKSERAVTTIMDIGKITFDHTVDADLANADVVIGAPDEDGNITITITSPDTPAGLKTELDKPAIDDAFDGFNKVIAVPAKQDVAVNDGTIYLLDGTRFDFDGNTALWTFEDQDVASLAAARTETDIDAEITTLETTDVYINFANAAAKTLITNLINAVKGLGANGQNRQALVDALTAIKPKAAGVDDADGTAARNLEGAQELIQSLITDADTLVAASDGIGSVADERVALTIYVSQDEGAETDDTSDDVWSAKAIETTDIGDLAGTTYYVIGTVDANGEPAMNTQGGADESGSVLTYTVTTPMPDTIKHVINIRNVDDNDTIFQAENGFRTPNDQDEASFRKNVGTKDAFTGRHLVQKDGDPNNSDAETFAYDDGLIDFTQTPSATSTFVNSSDFHVIIDVGGGKLYSGDGTTITTIASNENIPILTHTQIDVGVKVNATTEFKLIVDIKTKTVTAILSTDALTPDQFVLATFTITRSDNGTVGNPADDVLAFSKLTPNQTGEAVGTKDAGGQRQIIQAADFVIKGTDANKEIDEQATGDAAQKTFTIVATDADNVAGRNPNARLPITTKTEIITYELVADNDPTNIIDNDLASIDRNSGVLKFNAGEFDYENSRAREDAGGKYFLIQVKAISTSSLTNARAPQTTTKIFKIYVDQSNEAPTDLRINDGVEMFADLVAAVNDAYQTLIDNDDDSDDGTAATVEGTVGARVDALKAALDVLKVAYGAAGDDAAKVMLPQGLSAADYNALVTAAQKLLDHINAEGIVGTPAIPAEKFTALNIAADENNDITPLKLAFTNAIGANAVTGMQGREARLTIEEGYEKNPVKLALGTIKVTDSDVGDTHTFSIGEPLGKLFTVETDEGTGIHTLVYIGGTGGLTDLAAYIGGRFTLPITVTDKAGEKHTVNFSVVYEAAFVTTPALPADTTLENGNHQNTPPVDPVKLKSGETKTQTKKNTDQPTPTDVSQTVGGLFENADGNDGLGPDGAATDAGKIVIGAVSLAGVPLSKIKGVTVTSPGGTFNTEYEVKWGIVTASGTFAGAPSVAPSAQWWLLYKGTGALDYETVAALQTAASDETPTATPAANIAAEVKKKAADLVLNFDIDEMITGFTGQTGVQADGEANSGDTFSYSEVAVKVTESKVELYSIGKTVTDGFLVNHVTVKVVVNASQVADVTATYDSSNSVLTMTVKKVPAELSDAFFVAIDGVMNPSELGGLSGQGGISTEDLKAAFVDTIGSSDSAVTLETPTKLTVTVGALTLYTARGEVVPLAETTLTSSVSGEQFVFVIKDENGDWVLKLGAKPASGEFYVLTQALTPGTTGTGNAPLNTTGGTVVKDGTLNLPTKVKLPYVVPLKNLDDEKPAFDDGAALASDPQKFKLVNTDAEVNAAQVKDGTFTLTINGTEWTVIIATGDIGIVMGAAANPDAEPATAAVNTLTITLAAGAGHTVGTFVTAINNLSPTKLARLDPSLTEPRSEQDPTPVKRPSDDMEPIIRGWLTAGTHYDEYVRDANGNKIIENSNPVGESATGDDETPDGEATPETGAAVPDVEKTSFIGEEYSGVSTGIIVQGASDKDDDAIVYRLATAAATNDNDLVTLAVVNGKLTIVFKTGGPDFESVRGPSGSERTNGNYVFVVEAASTSELGDDSTDRSSRAGEKTVTQTYEYNVTDSDEAPWEITFGTASNVATNAGYTDIKVAGIQDDGTIATIDFRNDASDIPVAAEGAPANDKYDGVTIAIVEASFNGRQIDTAVFDVINPENGNLTWADKTGGRTITFLDDGTTYEMKRGDKLSVKISITDNDNSALSTTKDFEIVNGTVTLVTYDSLKTSYDTYSTTDNETNQKALKDAIDGIVASEANFSGVGVLKEDATGKTFLGILKSTGNAQHFWLVDHGDNHINSRFEIEKITLDDDGVADGDTTTFYALFLKAGEDVRNFEAGYIHDLDIGSSETEGDEPQLAAAVAAFTGQRLAQADGAAEGGLLANVDTRTFSFADSILANAPVDIHNDDPLTLSWRTLDIPDGSIYLPDGTKIEFTGKDFDSTRGGEIGTAIPDGKFAILVSRDDDDNDPSNGQGGAWTVKAVTINDDGSLGTILGAAVDAPQQIVGDYYVLATLDSREDNDGDPSNPVDTTGLVQKVSTFVKNSGTQITNNNLVFDELPQNNKWSTETYQVRPVNVNEAPDNLRILEQTIGENGQPTSQIALDWANAAPNGNTPPSAIAFDLNGAAAGTGDDAGSTDATNDLITGLKDGAIWTFDANGVGTPTYFQAPVNGQLQLPAGAATLYISQDADGIWRIKVIATADIGKPRDAATNPGLGAGGDADANPAIKHHILGTISAPNAGGGNARSFTHTAQVASATATVDESSDSTDPQSVILTAAHLRAADEDGINTESNTPTSPSNIVYIITGYQDADYHQTNSQTADDDRNVKMGWIEKNFGTTDNPDWRKLDVGSDTSKTDSSFTQADVNAGNVRFVSSGADGTTATFKYVVRDNRDTEAERKISPEQTATVNITNANDAPMVDNVKSHSFIRNHFSDYTIEVVGDAANDSAVRSVFDGANSKFTIYVRGNESVDEILAALFKTGDGSHGAQVVGILGFANEAEAKANESFLEGLKAAMLALDGNAPQKTATDAERTFTEATPQTPANISTSSKIGGIILNNAMFGIVDVDTPADQVKIWLHMDNLDTRGFLKIGGTPTDVVTRNDITGLPTDMSELLKAPIGKVGRVLVKVGSTGTEDDWVVLGQTIQDITGLAQNMQALFEGNVLTHFTLKQLIDGHVVFLHEVSHEAGNLSLRLRKFSDGTAETEEFSRSDDKYAVEFTITRTNDQPVKNNVMTGQAALTELQVGATPNEANRFKILPENLGFEDFEGDEITYVFDLSGNTDKFTFLVGSNAATAVERRPDGSNFVTVTATELQTGVFVVHRGPDATQTPINISYTVQSPNADDVTGNELSIAITRINDVPTDFSVNTSRISSQQLVHGVQNEASVEDDDIPTNLSEETIIARFSARDEEPGDLVYTLAAPSDDNDNQYFQLTDDGVLRFARNYGGERPKPLGATYNVEVILQDVDPDGDEGPLGVNEERKTFSFEVRDLDIDWNPLNANSVDDTSQTLEIKADEPSVSKSFSLLPIIDGAAERLNAANSSAATTNNQAAVAGVPTFRTSVTSAMLDRDGVSTSISIYEDWGILKITPAGQSLGSANSDRFTITFTVDQDSEVVKKLFAGETKTLKFEVPVSYIHSNGSEFKGTVTFDVQITGVNDAPVASAAANRADAYVEDRAATDDLTAKGSWGFSDIDRHQTDESQAHTAPVAIYLLAEMGGTRNVSDIRDLDIKASAENAASAPNTNRFVGETGQNNQWAKLLLGSAGNKAMLDALNGGKGALIVGKYGHLYIKSDYSWTYEGIAEKMTQVPALADAAIPIYDEFWLRVEDAANAKSEPVKIQVEVKGRNDAPTLALQGESQSIRETMTVERGSTTRDDGTGDDSVYDIAAGANPQTVSGRWTPIDPDNAARMKIEINNNDLGWKSAGNAATASRRDAPDGGDPDAGTFGGTVLNGQKAEATTLKFAGTYGDLFLHMDGTWEYVIDTNSDGTGRADYIAHDENPIDEFELRIADEVGQKSNVVIITITVDGINDAPTDLSNASSATTNGADSQRLDDGTLTLGIVTEAGARYGNDNMRDERTGDAVNAEAKGVSTISGTFDGVDVDRVATNGANGAIDEHHFTIKQYNGDGGTTAAVAGEITAATATTMALADAAWALFQFKTKAAWDAVTADAGVKATYTTAFTAATAADSAKKTALADAFTALGAATAGADYAAKLGDFYAALKALSATTEVTGKFGTLTLNKYSGQWEYVLDNADIDTQELDGGDVAYDVFTIIVTDEEGAAVEKQVRVRVTGENDASVLYLEDDNSPDDFTARESGTVRNTGDTANEAVAAQTASGRLGVFDIDQDGRAFLSDAANPADERTATARAVTAGHFSFEAANRVDPATFNEADTDVNRTRDGDDSVDEDAATIANSALTWISTDIDGGANDGGDAGSVKILGKFGLLTIAADGSWTYALFGEVGATQTGQNGVTDAMVTRVEKLGNGETRQEHFAIRVKDGSDTPSNIIQLSLTITGTNDAPTLEVRVAQPNAAEGGFNDAATPIAIVGTNVNGQLDVGDVDAEHDATVLFSKDDFRVGIKHKTAIGNTGGAGELAETDYAAVVGTDDNLTVSQQDSADSTSPHSGKRVGMQFTSFNLTHGTLYIWDDKTWMFVVTQEHDDVNGLNHDQVMAKTIEVTISDDDNVSVTRELVITITGANDKPAALTINDDVVVTTDLQLAEETDNTAEGSFSFTDIDKEHDASKLWANQDFNIELRHKTQILGSAETDWSTAVRGDGNGDGTVDDAVTTTTTSAVTQQQSSDATSPHAGKTAGTLFRAYNVEHGTVYIYDDKSWRFVLKQDHDDVQGLSHGQTMTKTFGMAVVDSKNGKTSEVTFTVTVTGTNDKARVVSSDLPASSGAAPLPTTLGGSHSWYLMKLQKFTSDYVMPDGSVATLTVPANQNAFANTSGEGAILSPEIGSPNDTRTSRSLKIGHRVETYKLYVEITLSNDLNTIETARYWFGFDGGNQSIPTDTETKKYIYVGDVEVDDRGSANIVVSTAGYHPYKGFAVESGDNPGVNNQQVSQPNTGDTVDITDFGNDINAHGYFIPTDIDAADNTANLGLKGWSVSAANAVSYDAAAAANKAEFRAKADSTGGSGAAATAKDLGNDMTIAGKYGDITLIWDSGYSGDDSTDGGGRWKWTYKLDQTREALKELNGYNATDDNSYAIDVFNFIITDSEGAETAYNIIINIQGSNDAPVIISATETTNPSVLADTATEAGGANNGINPKTTATGRINFTDDDAEHNADTGKNGFTYLVKSLLNGNDYHATTNTAASRGNDVNSTTVDAVKIGDNVGGVGTSDAFTEDPSGTALSGVYGHLAINKATGVWTYTLEQGRAATQALNEGDTAWEKFAIRIRDDEGGVSKTEYITIEIKGKNDAPVIESIDNGTGTEGVNATPAKHIDGQISITDVDGDDDPSNLFDNGFSVKASVVSSVTGGANALASGNDGDKGTGTYGTVPASPVVGSLHHDKGGKDYHSYDMTHGTLFIYEDGSYRFDIKDDNAEVNGLGSGQRIVKTITLVANDGTTDSAPKTFTITITGTNDRPVINAADASTNPSTLTGTITEAGGINNGKGPDNILGNADDVDSNKGTTTITGRLTVTDVDAGDSASDDFTFTAASATAITGTVAGNNLYATDEDPTDSDFTPNDDRNNYKVAGKFGTLQIKADGTWEYTVNQDKPEVQWLASSHSHTERFAVRVHDGEALSETQFITITINGADDTGVLSARTSTKNSRATNPNEDLARFEITDLDTSYNAGSITLSGDDATRFTHEVVAKPGAGNEHIYVVTVTWADGQKPSFDETAGADNQYNVTLNITGAPNYSLTVNVQPSTPEFVDNQGTPATTDDTVITTATVSKGELLGNDQEIYIANARQAGETALNSNIRYGFVTSSDTTTTTITVEGATFTIDADTGEITKTGGTFKNQDVASPDNSLDLTIRATDTQTSRFSDMVLRVNITNEDERPTALTVTPTSTDAYKENFDDDGWVTVATFTFTDPDNPAQGTNNLTARITSTPSSQSGTAEVRVEGNQIQMRGVNVAEDARDQQFQITLTPTTTGAGNELRSETFNVAVDGVVTLPEVRDIGINPPPPRSL